MTRGITGALCVILVGDRRPEQRHDAVSRVLVHRPLEAVHALGQYLEETVEDRMPLLGVELLGQFHRAFDIREQDRDLLALALERGARAQDLLRQVTRRVGDGGGCTRGRESAAATVTEARAAPRLSSAARAVHASAVAL